jgi:hypothetical protein
MECVASARRSLLRGSPPAVSVYVAERIEKPKYFRIAPARRGRGRRPVVVTGFDSEAEDGRPFTLQFSTTGDPADGHLLTVPEGKHAALRVFLTYLYQTTAKRDVEYVWFGWNLMYEWTQLFADLPADLIAQDTFHINVALHHLDPTLGVVGHYEIEVMNDRRYAMRIIHVESKVRVTVLDGMAYYKTSLDKAGRALKLGEKVSLDVDRKRRFTRADIDDPEFRRYAMTDAWLTRRIGEQIMDMHEQYDVTTCLTAPHFAAQVFKRHFLTGEVALPPAELEQAGLSAYHGGKNGFYLPGPARIDHLWAYDITSAYPEAMRQLPNPVTARWHAARRYRRGVHGLWCATMTYRGCPFPGALTHDDRKLTPGRYEALWLTSYELDAILDRGEATLEACHGFIMDGPGEGPMVDFVDRFFAQKAAYDSGPLREQAKLFLNSLYGKWFQKIALGTVGVVEWSTGEVRITDPSQAFDHRAGGLYHPPIAGLITGFVRARIHGLEHKYASVMTSTDGFFGTVPPDAGDVGKHLGGLTVEDGALSIWRERLYVFDPTDGGKPKVALHGFRGQVDQLRAIPLAPGAYTYSATAPVSLRQQRTRLGGRRVRAGQFVEREFTLVVEGQTG